MITNELAGLIILDRMTEMNERLVREAEGLWDGSGCFHCFVDLYISSRWVEIARWN